jgi:hypothetical protein
VVDRHTSPHVADPSAHRLRFDGRGNGDGEREVRAFADMVLARLEPQALLQRSALVVAAVVDERAPDGRSVLKVEAVLKEAAVLKDAGLGMEVGARIHAVLPDGREGAGGATTVFALTEPRPTLDGWQVADAVYVKVQVGAVPELLLR